MALTLVTPPTGYPLTLAEVRQQTKTEGVTADDSLITDLIIPGVTERCEIGTWRQLFTATWQDIRDRFPYEHWISVPKAPLVGDSVSITYVDALGVEQTLDPALYTVDAPAGPRCRPGRIALAYGAFWPATRWQINSVRIQFDAGYGSDATSVPALLKMAMLLDAGFLYRHREAILSGTRAAAIEVPLGTRSIYRAYRAGDRAHGQHGGGWWSGIGRIG